VSFERKKKKEKKENQGFSHLPKKGFSKKLLPLHKLNFRTILLTDCTSFTRMPQEAVNTLTKKKRKGKKNTLREKKKLVSQDEALT